MKVGIISDTHDNLKNIEKAVKIFNEEKVEIVIHAGDIISPFVINSLKKLNSKVKAVFGNNDGELLLLSKRFTEIGSIEKGPVEFLLDGRKVFLNHEPYNVDTIFKFGGYDIVIYGHTHEKLIKEENNKLLINPGECCGYLTGKGTVVILDTSNMKVEEVEL